MQSWSNPNPNEQTMAALAQRAQIQPTNIGSIMSAIMSFRQHEAARQDEEQRRAMQQIAQGVSGAVGAYQKNQQQGINDDTARAAMYFQQNPDAYQDYVMSGQVPAGITQGNDLNDPALMSAMAKYGDSDLERQLLEARINATNARAGQLSGAGGGGSNGPSLLDARRQQLIEQENDETTRSQLADMLGVSGKDMPQVLSEISGYRPGETEFPKFGPYQSGNETPGDFKQSVSDAVKAYLQSRSGNNQRTPDSVAQAAQAMGYGEGGERIEGATSSSTTSPKGQGPINGKPLDAATAKQFLEAANGDKDAARELARKAGYTF